MAMKTADELMEMLEPYEHGLDGLLIYLDRLRESGATNMFGAGVYLEEGFDLPRALARDVLMYWMDTFTDRHPA